MLKIKNSLTHHRRKLETSGFWQKMRSRRSDFIFLIRIFSRNNRVVQKNEGAISAKKS